MAALDLTSPLESDPSVADHRRVKSVSSGVFPNREPTETSTNHFQSPELTDHWVLLSYPVVFYIVLVFVVFILADVCLFVLFHD